MLSNNVLGRPSGNHDIEVLFANAQQFHEEYQLTRPQPSIPAWYIPSTDITAINVSCYDFYLLSSF